jgi:hypothetical protein
MISGQSAGLVAVMYPQAISRNLGREVHAPKILFLGIFRGSLPAAMRCSSAEKRDELTRCLMPSIPDLNRF